MHPNDNNARLWEETELGHNMQHLEESFILGHPNALAR